MYLAGYWHAGSLFGFGRRRSDSPAGKMTMSVINAVAEFERDLLTERTNASIKRAKSEEKIFGRPTALNDELQSLVAAIHAHQALAKKP